MATEPSNPKGGVGGCETLNLKRSGGLRKRRCETLNPKIGVSGCETLNPKRTRSQKRAKCFKVCLRRAGWLVVRLAMFHCRRSCSGKYRWTSTCCCRQRPRIREVKRQEQQVHGGHAPQPGLLRIHSGFAGQG